MASVQERLQLKREPLDKWSLREQLCLASAVARSGDQNWMSVSRALKPFGEANRPLDWFHQKNCAAQYGALLANVETPKRKKSRSGMETGVETPAECILKRLLADRKEELKALLAEEKAEYKNLQEDMKILQSGRVTEEQLDKWCKEIDEEESKREQEAMNHAKWLKQRDQRKQEIERAWRPLKAGYPVVGQKRKSSDVSEDFMEASDTQLQQSNQVPQQQQYQYLSPQQLQQKPPPQYSQQHISQQDIQQVMPMQQQESAKPALSPLLTSLLKSPSQVQNISSVPTSILHSAITSPNTKYVEAGASHSSPTITSLLNATSNATVATNLQQLTVCGLNQDGNNLGPVDDASNGLDADFLDDANIKIDDLAKSILVQDGPFPEIKKEEVDDIISEIIEHAQDIVADPEQHLQLDGNGDISINLELDDLEQEDEMQESLVEEEAVQKKDEIIPEAKIEEKPPVEKTPQPPPVIDPFEFQEDPVLFESPVKPSTMKQDNSPYTPLYQQSPIKSEESSRKNSENSDISLIPSINVYEPNKEDKPKNIHGSVEIVEVIAEEHENEKELNKAQIRDIVHSIKEKEEKSDTTTPEVTSDTSESTSYQSQIISAVSAENEVAEVKEEEGSKDGGLFTEQKTSDSSSDVNIATMANRSGSTSDFADDIYEVSMEVKIDKTGKTKRDYSRLKKKEEKSFDMLLAIEKAQDEMSLSDDMPEFKAEKKEPLKVDNDRSTSPWTEEEVTSKTSKIRRYSTPVTPFDSLPNSPASSTHYYDDDRDHRNWKKSVMLVYNRLASHKYASLFLKPITDDQAPGYSLVVYRPMDLQTIKKNIDNGHIRTSLEFKRDVMLMFTNAIMYNKTNDTIYKMASFMQQEAMEPIEILLQAESQVEAPMRRETRTSESSCKRKRIPDEPIKNKKKRED